MQISDLHRLKLYFFKFSLQNQLSFKKRGKDCVRTIRRRGMKLKRLNEEIGFQTRRRKRDISEWNYEELCIVYETWLKTQEESEVSERNARWEETSEEANQTLIIKKLSNLNSNKERGWCDEKAKQRDDSKKEKSLSPLLTPLCTSQSPRKSKSNTNFSVHFKIEINYFYLL